MIGGTLHGIFPINQTTFIGGSNVNHVAFAIVIMMFVVLIAMFYLLRQSKKKSHKITIQRINDAESRIRKKRKYVDDPVENSAPSLLDVLAAARYYQNGILDSYDVAGRKIPGIKPNPTKAIYYYKQAIALGYTKAAYDIAAIHHHGCGDYEGSPEAAIKVYEEILDRTKDQNDDTVNRYLQRQIDDLDREVARREIAGFFPEHNTFIPPSMTVFPKITSYPRFTPINQPQQVKTVSSILRSNGAVFKPAKGFNRGDYADDNAVLTVLNNHTPAPITIGQTYSDAHNTHDTTVNASIRSAIEKISASTKLDKSQEQTISEVRAFINKYAEADKRKDAIMALDAIERNFIPVSNVNKKESEVLQLVWNRIHDPINESQTNNLKENLVDYLSECVEYGKVCCPTGRINRIADSLNAVDPDVQIRSTSMINGEIMNKASKIRETMYDSLDDTTKNKIDSPDDTPEATKFKQDLQQKIRDTVKSEYIDAGLVRKEQADQMLAQWIDHI